MSANNHTYNKKTSREDRKKLVVRVLCLILAALMVLGVAYYTIVMLASSASAASVTDEETEVIDTSSLKNSGDVLVAVGLMYDDNLTTGFEISTEEGYYLGIQELDGDRDFTELWETDETILSCTSDANLSKTGMTFLITTSESKTAVGGYHVEVDCSDLTRTELKKLIRSTEDEAEELGLGLIPAWYCGSYRLRVGAFPSEEAAEYYLEDVEELFPRYDVSVAYPTDTAVSLLNPYTNQIVFEYDDRGRTELGIAAMENDDGNTYIRTPAGNDYDGVFCFKRYDNGETDGVSLINILPLEAYIAGVLPYETSNTWPLETLKAFAVTVRSFTLTHLGYHEHFHFDLCNTTDCQVYKGAGRINDRVMKAVLGTAGQVMTYDGEIVNAYYSSSMGGVTVSAQDAWGGSTDIPYLQAVETPWEDYMNHSNGFWINEVSPEALCSRLNQAGYTTLKKAIEDVEIVELAKNSTYVKVLRVTDVYGHSVDITYTDKVRTSLSPYVKSANFKVGRGQVEYTEDVVIQHKVSEPQPRTVDLGEYDKAYGYINVDDIYVETYEESGERFSGRTLSICTESGELDYGKIDVFVITADNAAAYLGEEYVSSYTADPDELDYNTQYNTEVIGDKSTDDVLNKIAYAENEDNFIFVGKGWGHGVGMSQYGARDLAELGYDSDYILRAYFKGITLMDYTASKDFRKK